MCQGPTLRRASLWSGRVEGDPWERYPLCPGALERDVTRFAIAHAWTRLCCHIKPVAHAVLVHAFRAYAARGFADVGNGGLARVCMQVSHS